MDEPKEPESEQMTPEELAKVAGGATSTGTDHWYCLSNGTPHFGKGTDAGGWRYDATTGTCKPSNYTGT